MSTNATDSESRPARWKIWVRAARPFSFTASLMPVAVGAAFALGSSGPVAWWLLPLVAAGSLLLHAGTNFVSDAADYKRGVDREGTHGGSGVLVERLLTGRQVFLAGLLTFAAACGIGVVLIFFRGWPIVWLGLAGLVGGFFYGGWKFGYKYLALGDLAVFILMGPLTVVGAHFALTGYFDLHALYVSLPVGCLVCAILHANNARDIAYDSQAGVRTVANVVGLRASKIEYGLLVAAAYAIVAALSATGVIGLWSLLALVSLPMAAMRVRSMLQADPDDSKRIAMLDVQTAQLHLIFTVLLSLGLVVSVFA